MTKQLLVCSAMTILFDACTSTPELKETSVLVTECSDSTITATSGDADFFFTSRNAHFIGDLLIPGDSAKIHYTEDKSGLKAHVVTALPRASQIVEAGYDSSKELITVSRDTLEEQN